MFLDFSTTLILFAAFCIGLLAQFLCMNYFLKKQFLDIPNTELKKHKNSTPFSGGLGIFCTMIASNILCIAIGFPISDLVFLNLFLPLSLFLCFGFIDDFYRISPAQKSILYSVLAVILTLFFVTPFLIGVIRFVLLVYSVFVMINLFNLIDISDGLLASTVLPSFFGLIFLAFFLKLGGTFLFLSLSVAAIIAFLGFNKSPARIFAGENGSLLMSGLMSAGIFLFLWHINFFKLLLFAVFILSVPLAEMFMLVLIRSRLSIPFYNGSPHHFGIYLKNQGMTSGQVALFSFCSSSTAVALACLWITDLISLTQTIFLFSVGFAGWVFLVYSPLQPLKKIFFSIKKE